MAAAIDAQPSNQDALAEFSAPFLLRCGAVLIDYIIFLILPVGGLLSERIFSGGLDIVTDATLWFLSVLLSIFNLLILPLVCRQSIGKLLTGLRIVSSKGERAGFGSILLRQTLGYLLTLATLCIGFLICLFTPKSRTLHDYISGTRVVRATRREIQ
ncbi:MAG: RDD family protein [Acidobacteria bacterium]|nr:RDD family protein [Acidobacteriota bacterium]